MTTMRVLATIARFALRLIWRFAQWTLFGIFPPLWRIFWIRAGCRVSESGVNYLVKEVVKGRVGCQDTTGRIKIFDRTELGPAIPWQR